MPGRSLLRPDCRPDRHWAVKTGQPRILERAAADEWPGRSWLARSEQGRAVVSAAVGLVVVLLVSGLIEAFVTPSPLPTVVRIGIGILAEAGFLTYVVYFGRRAVRAGGMPDQRVRRFGVGSRGLLHPPRGGSRGPVAGVCRAGRQRQRQQGQGEGAEGPAWRGAAHGSLPPGGERSLMQRCSEPEEGGKASAAARNVPVTS